MISVTVKGIIEDIIYKNEDNGYTVCFVESKEEGSFTAVGYMSSVAIGQNVALTGKWVDHPDYGEQLKLEYYEILLPTEEDNILKYLSSGVVSGIRSATAKKLVEKFGKETLNIMLSEPLKLAEIKGISKEKARKIGESFYRIQAVQNIVMFLQKYNVSANMAIKVNKILGDRAVERIKENPYILADNVDGITFASADSIAMAQGFAYNSPFRIKSGIKYLLKTEGYVGGHTFLPENILKEHGAKKLNVTEEEIENSLSGLISVKELYKDTVNGENVCYLASYYTAEKYVAGRISSLVEIEKDALLANWQIEDEILQIEKRDNITLAREQKNAVFEALGTSGCLVLTGGPGTGKTTTINTILEIMGNLKLKVALAAPTGRAAKRMSQVTGKAAKTIHRLLEAVGVSEETRFNRNEENPLSADVVILDEVSMIDITLMHSFLKALRPGARLILSGDADQLPSVGAGNVLNDIINSDVVPTVRLSKIFRQAEQSLIVVNAHRINRGEYPEIKNNENDFFFLPRATQKSICDTIADLYKNRLPKAYNIDPLTSIQVLSPAKKGIAGSINLNTVLQNTINPPDITKAEYAYGSRVFRVGDKVMQTKNNYDMYYSRKDGDDGMGVFNGDMGVIEDIFPIDKIMVIVFDDERRVEYPFSNLDELDLAYAITVHKSQGNEFPILIMPVCGFPPLLMCRNLFYTAVTRAKDMVVLVGNEESIKFMTDNNRENSRYTGLLEKIRNNIL